MASPYQGEYDHNYQIHKQVCEKLGYEPSNYQTWLKVSKGISDVFFSFMPGKRAS